MVGSVMDYNPINIAPKGQKQGDYITTTIGPYDYWAIEYAYKPIDGDEAAELKKIAARSPEPDLVFATDEDMFLNNDPLGEHLRPRLRHPPVRQGPDRAGVGELLKDLDAKVVKDGEAWSESATAFSILLDQWGNACRPGRRSTSAASRSRATTRAIRTPATRSFRSPAAKQRECLTFLVDQILSDRAFQFSPALLRRLASRALVRTGARTAFFGSSVDYRSTSESSRSRRSCWATAWPGHALPARKPGAPVRSGLEPAAAWPKFSAR